MVWEARYAEALRRSVRYQTENRLGICRPSLVAGGVSAYVGLRAVAGRIQSTMTALRSIVLLATRSSVPSASQEDVDAVPPDGSRGRRGAATSATVKHCQAQ